MQTSDHSDMKLSSNSMNEDNMSDRADARYAAAYENNYNEVPEQMADNVPGEVYYRMMDGDVQLPADMQNIPYMTSGIAEAGTPVDTTAMQAAAFANHSMMFQNSAQPCGYAQYPPMFNGLGSMYGGVPPYCGGNVPMAMNPYYDPYGIINPLASAALNTEKPKKKTKRFLCC